MAFSERPYASAYGTPCSSPSSSSASSARDSPPSGLPSPRPRAGALRAPQRRAARARPQMSDNAAERAQCPRPPRARNAGSAAARAVPAGAHSGPASPPWGSGRCASGAWRANSSRRPHACTPRARGACRGAGTDPPAAHWPPAAQSTRGAAIARSRPQGPDRPGSRSPHTAVAGRASRGTARPTGSSCRGVPLHHHHPAVVVVHTSQRGARGDCVHALEEP
jgi:hypothetical protein